MNIVTKNDRKNEQNGKKERVWRRCTGERVEEVWIRWAPRGAGLVSYDPI